MAGVGWVACMVLDLTSPVRAAACKGRRVVRSGAALKDGVFAQGGMIVVVAGGRWERIAHSPPLLENLALVACPSSTAGLICPLVLVWYNRH